MKPRLMLTLAISALASVSCGTNVGEAAFDAAYVFGQASELRECRQTYERTGDSFRLQECEAELLQH